MLLNSKVTTGNNTVGNLKNMSAYSGEMIYWVVGEDQYENIPK